MKHFPLRKPYYHVTNNWLSLRRGQLKSTQTQNHRCWQTNVPSCLLFPEKGASLISRLLISWLLCYKNWWWRRRRRRRHCLDLHWINLNSKVSTMPNFYQTERASVTVLSRACSWDSPGKNREQRKLVSCLLVGSFSTFWNLNKQGKKSIWSPPEDTVCVLMVVDKWGVKRPGNWGK